MSLSCMWQSYEHVAAVTVKCCCYYCSWPESVWIDSVSNWNHVLFAATEKKLKVHSCNIAFNNSYKYFTRKVLHCGVNSKLLFWSSIIRKHWIWIQHNLNTTPEQLRVKVSQQLQARLKSITATLNQRFTNYCRELQLCTGHISC